MTRELTRFGLLDDPRVEFFQAYQFTDPGPFARAGSRGAFHSHLHILKDAAAANQSVLILQDDCEFLQSVRTSTPREDTDIFYGGYHALDPDDLHNSPIIGAHCMGFSAKAAREAALYLEAYLSPDFEPDRRAASEPGYNPRIKPPIDGAFVWFRRKHPELRTEFRLLSVQRSSVTDIGERRLRDRVWGLHRAVRMARRLRRSWGKPAA